MLTQAVGDVLPTAVGVALSPVPIIAVVLMLATPRARSNGVAFSTGWVLGLVAVSVVVLVLADGASVTDSATSTGVSWLQVGLGLVFLAMAWKQWQARPRPGDEPVLPGWMTSIDSFTAAKALALGALLSGVNPKNLALSISAGASIAQAGTTGSDTVVAVVVFGALASVSVVGPVIAFLLAPRAAADALGSVKQVMSDHNAVIMVVVLIVMGAKLVGQGIDAGGA